MSGKTEHRIKKVVAAVKAAVTEGQAEAMQGFLMSTADWPFMWRLRLAVGIVFKRYRKRS